MIIAIIGIIIGLLVAGAGIYFLKEDKDNAESKKIYSKRESNPISPKRTFSRL